MAEPQTTVDVNLEDDPHGRWAGNPHTVLMFVVVAVAIVVAVSAVSAWYVVWTDRRQINPISISACATTDFDTNSSCAGKPAVDPEALIADDDLALAVSGRVILDSPVPVAYQVTVTWESVETEISYTVIDVPIVYEAGRNAPYEVEWTIPDGLYESTSTVPAGASLGRWRIVGRAVPVSDKYETYQWDSVKTFELIQGQRKPGG